MGKVIFDISMSRDGSITASNRRPEEPMGDGGQRLHEWAFGEDERNSKLLADAVAKRHRNDLRDPPAFSHRQVKQLAAMASGCVRR